MSTAQIAEVLRRYDGSALTLCSIGSHSALEVAYGALRQGLRNLIVTAKGRERTYARHFIARGDPVARGCVDAILELPAFADILRDDVQQELLRRNVIFVPNRSFEVYLRQKYSYGEIEQGMRVPFFGNRYLLKAEERDAQGPGTGDQYALLRAARIRHPRRF
ncbi:MAG: DUF1246 domain-containing protein, partial [Candidatus Eremiobacteraeota bacterium]|nr:DUF1246 domain-containing protein [Candidatus Eremiobacteraeota bacterium]